MAKAKAKASIEAKLFIVALLNAVTVEKPGTGSSTHVQEGKQAPGPASQRPMREPLEAVSRIIKAGTAFRLVPLEAAKRATSEASP